ncbi:MAG: hypothetical protein AAF242_21320 [Bacteroidota bacterium]
MFGIFSRIRATIKKELREDLIHYVDHVIKPDLKAEILEEIGEGGGKPPFIGIKYSSDAIKDMLKSGKAAEPNGQTFVGLAFSLGSLATEKRLQIDWVYFDASIPTFFKVTPNQKQPKPKKIWKMADRGDDYLRASDKKSGQEELKPSDFEYYKDDFGFAYFSEQELNILATAFENLIFSGGSVRYGRTAKQKWSPTDRKIVNQLKRGSFTLKVEGDEIRSQRQTEAASKVMLKSSTRGKNVGIMYARMGAECPIPWYEN